jgi:hypothetical protein
MSPRIQTVYDGQERLGIIEQRGHELVAYNNRREELGTFTTMHDAIGAISAAAAAEARAS